MGRGTRASVAREIACPGWRRRGRGGNTPYPQEELVLTGLWKARERYFI